MADRSARFQQKNFPYGDRSANPGLASRLRPAIASNRIWGLAPPGAQRDFRNCADCTKGRHFICENCIVDFLVKFRHNRPLSAGANGHGKSPHYRRLSQFFIIAFLYSFSSRTKNRTMKSIKLITGITKSINTFRVSIKIFATPCFLNLKLGKSFLNSTISAYTLMYTNTTITAQAIM